MFLAASVQTSEEDELLLSLKCCGTFLRSWQTTWRAATGVGPETGDLEKEKRAVDGRHV